MLKKSIVAAAVSALILSCGGGGKGEIKWEKRDVTPSKYAVAADSISVSYPFAAGGKNAKLINGQIAEMLTFTVGYPGENLSAAIDSLLAGRGTAGGGIPYTVMVDGEGSNFGNVACARLFVYQYTGGAHGLATETYLNFDTRTGGQLELADMFTDTTALRTINIESFRAARSGEWEDGMFVALSQLPLPASAGMSAEGLRVHYNPYEIAPYVFGATDYTIPIAAIRPLLNKELFP